MGPPIANESRGVVAGAKFGGRDGSASMDCGDEFASMDRRDEFFFFQSSMDRRDEFPSTSNEIERVGLRTSFRYSKV